jgi:pimeloyl-ACP methyl ester carboxylesterase
MPYVQLDDIKMFYRVIVAGEEVDAIDKSKPVLIVCHGGLGILDHGMEFNKHWQQFSKNIQVVFIDQRGCGKTHDGDPGKWTMDQFGDDIFNFAAALDLQDVVLGGVSSGGFAAFACASRHPGFLKGMVIANTEPVVNPSHKSDAYIAQAKRDDRREFAAFKDLADDIAIEALAAEAAEAVVAYDEDPSDENFERFVQSGGFGLISKGDLMSIWVEPSRKNEKMKSIFANGYGKFDYSDVISKIDCRVLWFAGEWDTLHPVAGAKEGAELLNKEKSTLIVLQAGAPIYLDAPNEFRDITFYFLHGLGYCEELTFEVEGEEKNGNSNCR